MFKFNFDNEKLKKQIKDYAESIVQGALTKAVSKGSAKAASMAAESYSDKPYSFWKNGFGVDRVDENTFVMTLSGDMAAYMDDGDMEGVRQKILNGNRARYNKLDGKDYVDVPFVKDADAAGNIKGTNLNVQSFRDANSLIESFKQSRPMNKDKISRQKAVVKNVQDVINKQNVKQSKPVGGAKSSYVVIKRVSEKSKEWKQYQNAPKVFGQNNGELINYIDKEFQDFLRRI